MNDDLKLLSQAHDIVAKMAIIWSTRFARAIVDNEMDLIDEAKGEDAEAFEVWQMIEKLQKVAFSAQFIEQMHMFVQKKAQEAQATNPSLGVEHSGMVQVVSHIPSQLPPDNHPISVMYDSVMSGNLSQASAMLQKLFGLTPDRAETCVLHFADRLHDPEAITHIQTLRQHERATASEIIISMQRLFGLKLGEAMISHQKMMGYL